MGFPPSSRMVSIHILLPHRQLGTHQLHLIIESPRWTRFVETCTEGATLKFVAENRLAIQTSSWLGIGTVRSSMGCTNTTRCGDNMNTVVQLSSGMLKVQHDILGVTCDSDTRKERCLYQIECGGRDEAGCLIYGPGWLREEVIETKANWTDDAGQPIPEDEIPKAEGNQFQYRRGDG